MQETEYNRENLSIWKNVIIFEKNGGNWKYLKVI